MFQKTILMVEYDFPIEEEGCAFKLEKKKGSAYFKNTQKIM